jgi:colanic acid/amylovoran biosynthesis protein
VALLWHTFGQGNLGVDALARANATIIRSAAKRAGRDVRFTTVGFGQPDDVTDLPADVVVGDGPKIKKMLRGQSNYLASMRSSDLVVDIGEGDSWTDIYGLRRYLLQVGSKLTALAMGKPLVLAPQTMGPFENKARRWLATRVMNGATAVFARDELSMAYLQKQKITAPIDEYVDVAFRLPFTPQPKMPGKVRVGLNVSGLLYRGGYSGANELGMALDYKRLSDTLIENLLARDEVEVHLIAHVVSKKTGNDDDGSIIPDLVARFPALKVAPAFSTASEAKSYMSGLDFVVAGRMHACIGAFSSGVPVVPIAYSRKFNGLFGTLGYQYFVDGKATDTDEAISRTLQWFDERDVLAKALVAGRALAEKRLAAYEDRLVALIERLSGAS